MTPDHADRAWRRAQVAGLITLAASPVVGAVAWTIAGVWTLLVTVPGCAGLVLVAMWAVETIAGARLARAAGDGHDAAADAETAA